MVQAAMGQEIPGPRVSMEDEYIYHHPPALENSNVKNGCEETSHIFTAINLFRQEE